MQNIPKRGLIVEITPKFKIELTNISALIEASPYRDKKFSTSCTVRTSSSPFLFRTTESFTPQISLSLPYSFSHAATYQLLQPFPTQRERENQWGIVAPMTPADDWPSALPAAAQPPPPLLQTTPLTSSSSLAATPPSTLRSRSPLSLALLLSQVRIGILTPQLRLRYSYLLLIFRVLFFSQCRH